MLTVVIGPPAAGKSTWVLNHAGPADVVIDFDRIAQAVAGPGADGHDHAPAVAAVARAARTAALDAAIKQARTADVYVIHSSPGPARMDQYRALGARVVMVDPGRDIVRKQASGERPQRMYAAIDEWYQHRERLAQYVRDEPEQTAAMVTSRDW